MAIGTKLFHRWQSLPKIGYEMKAIWEMSAKRFVPFICLGLFLALRVWDPTPLEVLRVRTFDFYQNLHPREFTPQPIVIVDLDEESLAEVGQWPWPRTVISDMVANI